MEIKVGQVIDMLTAVRLVGIRVTGRKRIRIWELRCECGCIVERREESFNGKSLKSCGCHLKKARAEKLDALLEPAPKETPGRRLIRERHPTGRSFGVGNPGKGMSSLEYI